MIIRENYLEQLRHLKDKRLIKVVTGVRRSGKSTLLELFREDLRRQGVKKSQIQAYNFEEQQDEDLYDQRKLHDHIMSKTVPESMNYIFLDEIQKVEHFEACVASLAVKENIDVYITGSNAFLLSGELATYLTGRYISIHVLPLSFAEYRQAFPDELNEENLFLQYMNTTAFPEATNIFPDSPSSAMVYLDDLYKTIVEKDIFTRHEVKNRQVFQKMFEFILDSIGNPISANSIANFLAAQNSSVHRETISEYLRYLTECYVLYPASRYDIKGKNLLSSNEKYYVVDLGFRRLLLGQDPNRDRGHLLENIVYLELVRRFGNRVYVGKNGDKEVDFIVQKYNGEKEYFQVAYELLPEETFEREITPLRKIQDNYPKTILTMEGFDENYAGIKKINVVNWLLEK